MNKSPWRSIALRTFTYSYMAKITQRKSFRYIHLFIGLVAGIIVFIEAITGSLWVFHDEIDALLHEDIVVQAKEAPFVTPSQVKVIAGEAIPGKAIHGVLYPNSNHQPLEIIFYEEDPEFYTSLFIDPYSGDVLKKEDHLKGFFAFVLDGHLHLWLPEEIGKPIVSYGTLLFLISIITGIVLWWPKNKKGLRQRIKFDWRNGVRWRRKNFDLHTVLGFYVSAVAFIFVITGLVMALNWFYFIYYKGFGGEREPQFLIPNNEKEYVEKTNETAPIDRLPEVLMSRYPDAKDYEIHYPYADSVSIYVEVSYQDITYYDSDYLFFDQSTLEEVPTTSIYGRRSEADLADQMIRMNYDIHVGTIFGLPTKILAFLASLTIATLPVTGVLLYLGRIRKSRRNTLALSRAI